MASTFTWLDYSERDRRRMLDVVDQFKERDTRDELGIGAVRDSFADQLFPGTSTIMTRARYFLLVPWTYQRLEERRIPSAHIHEKARQAETKLIDSIERSDDNDGNIGKYAKTALKRLPSSVYWQGLGVWGIRTFAGAQSQYHRCLDQHYLHLGRHSGRKSERDAEHDDLAKSNWIGGLIPPPEDFPEECSLRLRRCDAEYLSERIRLSPLCAGSLLAELVARSDYGNVSVEFAWQHPCVSELSERLRELLRHAENFSAVMHGSALFYNLILARQSKWQDGVNDYEERLRDWESEMTERSRTLAEWHRPKFWELAHAGNPRISKGTEDFINAWWDLTRDGIATNHIDLRRAEKLICDRERAIKKNLARIDNPRAQELWNGDAGSAQLEFRWRVSQRLLSDIFHGLEASDA